MSPASSMVWIATGAGVVIVGVAILAVAASVVAPSGSHEAGTARLLNIAVVAAKERNIPPGGVLDVGHLTDGYVHRNVSSQAAAETTDAYLADEDVSYTLPTSVHTPQGGAATPYALTDTVNAAPDAPGPHNHAEGRPLSFGFDAPRPDYAVERAARRARLDALEAEARARTANDAATAPDTFY